MIIGMDDDGTVFGVENPQKLLETIPVDIRNKLDIRYSLTVISKDRKKCVKITVEKGSRLLDLDGVYYKRVGSTTQVVTGEELRDWIVSDSGISWTDLPTDKVTTEELSQNAIDLFIDKGISAGRMSLNARDGDRRTLLRNYDLMKNDSLLRSGAVLFSENPWRISKASHVKIGAFSEDGTLLRDDFIEGPVIMQPDRVMDILLNKYVQGTNKVEGLAMVVKYPYPEIALREAVMNAIVHRDYSSVVDTNIRVYPDCVKISNPGNLPAGWTAENLFKAHDSKPANPAIAQVFFTMKYIEKYGTGIGTIRKECAKMGLPEPEYNVEKKRIEIVFRLPEKDDDTSRRGVQKRQKEMRPLSKNEQIVFDIILTQNAINIKDVSEMSEIPYATVKRIADKLEKDGFIRKTGTKRSLLLSAIQDSE